MPRLDFREALLTPAEKRSFPDATVTPVSAAAPANQTRNSFLRGVRLSRSTWTNIVFVAVASVGGLVCAFYFFNGGELLRAAAAWPNEFLYPRPFSTDKIDIGQQPNPVDQFSQFTKSASGSSKTDATAQSPLGKNVRPADFAQPATAINTTNPTGPGAPSSSPSLLSDAASLVSGLNVLPPGADTLFQSFYQTATSMTPKMTMPRTAKSTISSTRRKVSKTKQKVTATTTRVASTAKMTQQTANQSQMNTVRAPNQMMMGGGVGGVGAAGGVGAVGGIGGLGAGLGGLGLGHH
jgi:hypothetical protein